ncbi:MAG: ribosome maturation factor RimM [Clostridiales Family XIII bacterium]|jgi:16S rRNA processing protein RimM|nr:ribosome maturation factor RimM [Clostridiales Family XIII bacterium]
MSKSSGNQPEKGPKDVNAAGYIHIGKVGGVHGIRGEIKLYHFSRQANSLEGLKELFLNIQNNKKDNLQRFEIEKIRIHKNVPMLKLVGIDDRNAAEALMKVDAYIKEDNLAELEEGNFYVRDLIGLEVFETATTLRGGASQNAHILLGTVIDVIDNPAHDLLEVRLDRGYSTCDDICKTVLVPMVDAFILGIDIEARKILVELPEGLLNPENA